MRKFVKSVFAVSLIVGPFSILAQAPPPPIYAPPVPTISSSLASYYTQLAMVIIATLVPMVVAGIKVYFPKLEKSHSHLFPIFAVALGGAFTWAINAATSAHIPGLLGVFLGAAGIGLREIYDQTKQMWPTIPALPVTVTTTSGVNNVPPVLYQTTTWQPTPVTANIPVAITPAAPLPIGHPDNPSPGATLAAGKLVPAIPNTSGSPGTSTNPSSVTT